MSRTKQTFDRFRYKYPEKECPPVQNVDQKLEMFTADGLEVWRDGPDGPVDEAAPALEKNHPDIRLWVVRAEDVVHALEQCSFGAGPESGVIKHSNLTGARPAHCGGQMVFIRAGVIALDGGSGRYGPGSKDEMTAVAKAFKNSGYGVWSYGYDEENAWPFRIGSRLPELVK